MSERDQSGGAAIPAYVHCFPVEASACLRHCGLRQCDHPGPELLFLRGRVDIVFAHEFEFSVTAGAKQADIDVNAVECELRDSQIDHDVSNRLRAANQKVAVGRLVERLRVNRRLLRNTCRSRAVLEILLRLTINLY
jgi:hypothetical protein